MGNFLKNKLADSFVGINLGNFYIKGLLIKEGQVRDYFIEKKEDLPTTIEKIWTNRKSLPRRVRVSVKNSACLVRYFSFPKMDKKRMQQAIFYEMAKFIPFSPHEVYFDYYVLKEISPEEVFILLAVAKKDFIDKILEIFTKANLTVSQINLDSIALINLFFNNYPDNKDINSCLLDIGYNFSVMTILNKGIPFLTRDIKFSTKDVFEVISRLKNINFSQVEKWLDSLKTPDEFLKLAQDNISSLCKEMKSSFDYFEVNKAEHLNKIFITGGLASLKGIGNIFSEALEIDTVILDVFPKNKKLNLTFSDTKFNAFINSFSVPFGLIL